MSQPRRGGGIACQNPTQILQTVNGIFDGVRAAVSFERALRNADVPPVLQNVRDSLKGISFSITLDVVHFAKDWKQAVAGLQNGSREFKVQAIVNVPPQFEKFSEAVQQLTKTL